MTTFDQGESCGNTALSYSSLPGRDVSFTGASEQIIDCGLNLPQPVDNLTLKFPLGEGKQLVDGLQLAFRARFQIRNADGTLLKEDKLLAPICGIAGTVIDRLEVWAGGKPLRIYNLFAYLYHILNLLHRPYRWFKTMGSCNGFIPDDTTFDDDASWLTNKGQASRREWAQKSKEFEVTDNLFIPMFWQSRLIPLDNRFFTIQLHLNKSAFLLYKEKDVKEDFKLYLLKAELLVTKINLTEKAAEAVGNTDTLLLPFADYEIQSFSLYDSVLQRSLPTATLERYPKRMYFVIVAQDKVAGSTRNNPLVYKNYDLESLSLDLGGQIFNTGQMELTDGKALATSVYWNLIYRALGKTDGDMLFDIKTWSRMYSIFCWDCTPNRFSAECPMVTTPLEPVNYSVNLKFRTKLPEACQLIVISETERVTTCSSDGSVIIN